MSSPPTTTVEDLRSRALLAAGVPHLFTTAPAETPEDASRLGSLAARDLASSGSTVARRLVQVRQVHGAGVVRVVDAEDGSPTPEADGLVTDRSDRWLAVRSADCVPVLLASRDGRCVGAVHAGWRGLVAGVIPAALDSMSPRASAAVVGPCISVEHFEVGPEVADAFRAAGLGAAVHEGGGTRSRIDLRRAARLQLERGGVEHVEELSPCTYAVPALPSHRRDVTHGGRPSTGRLIALIGPRGR